MVNNAILEKTKFLLPRRIESELKKSIFSDEILVLTGPRQVGKTSLCLRLIHYLLNEEKVPQEQIVYLDLEFPNILSEVNNLYKIPYMLSSISAKKAKLLKGSAAKPRI